MQGRHSTTKLSEEGSVLQIMVQKADAEWLTMNSALKMIITIIIRAQKMFPSRYSTVYQKYFGKLGDELLAG